MLRNVLIQINAFKRKRTHIQGVPTSLCLITKFETVSFRDIVWSTKIFEMFVYHIKSHLRQ